MSSGSSRPIDVQLLHYLCSNSSTSFFFVATVSQWWQASACRNMTIQTVWYSSSRNQNRWSLLLWRVFAQQLGLLTVVCQLSDKFIFDARKSVPTPQPTIVLKYFTR